MKTNRLFILAATSLLMLTACGSKGGKSESQQTSSQQTSSQQQSSEKSSEASQEHSELPPEESSAEQSEELSSEAQSSEASQEASSEQSAELSSEELSSEQSEELSSEQSEELSSEELSSEASEEESSDSSEEEEVEITIWTTYNDTYQSILNACAEELHSLYPNITVNNVKQQGSYDDLKNMCINGFAVDNYPDMVAAYPDSVADFINNARALDMDEYMNDPDIGWTSADFDDIPAAYIEAGQQYSIPGTYSLPASKSTEALYYNQDVLVGLNLSEIDPTINGGKALNDAYLKDLTWEELFEKLVPALDAYDQAQDASHKIIDRTTFSDWAWVGYDSDDNFFITLAEQYGYGYTAVNQKTGKGQLLFNNDGMKDLMKKFVGYQKQHYFTTKGIINTNVNYRSTADAMLFSIGSTGGVKYQFSADNPHNVGVGHLPTAYGGETSVISQGPDFAFLDHDNDARARATWLFYKLFTSAKYNIQWATTTGYSPVRYSVMESAAYQAYADYEQYDEKSQDRLTALNAVYAASVSDDLFTSPVFKGSSEARVQVGTIFASCAAASDLDSAIDGIFQTAYDNTVLKM